MHTRTHTNKCLEIGKCIVGFLIIHSPFITTIVYVQWEGSTGKNVTDMVSFKDCMG